MKYFELCDQADLHVEQRWHLESPIFLGTREYVHSWPLISGVAVDPSDFREINFPIQYEGPRSNFVFGGSSGVPLIHCSLAPTVIQFGADFIKLLPCHIGGVDLGYSILVVEKAVPCLDPAASVIDFYGANECEIAKIGTIKYIRELKVDASKIAPETHIFRMFENPSVLIVSQSLKDALVSKSISGVRFSAV